MTVVDDVIDALDNVFSTISLYSKSHQDGSTALILLFGVIIVFTGKALLRPTVFLLGFLPTSTVMSSFGIALVADITDHASSPNKFVIYVDVIIIIISLILGLLVGVVMVRLLLRVTTFVICGASGAVMVALVYLFFIHPPTSRNVLFVWYAVMLLAVIVTALLSVTYPDTAIILGTSFDGAALAVASMARFLGHRPTLFHPFSASPTPSSAPPGSAPPSIDHADNWWAMSYAVTLLILAAFGSATQYRIVSAERLVARDAEQRRQQYQPLSIHTLDSSRPLADQYLFSTVVEDLPVDKVTGQIQTNHDSSEFLLPSSNGEERITVTEPPTPTHNSPGYPGNHRYQTSHPKYGSNNTEDAQYSVIYNLGAQPLAPSSYSYERGSKSPK